MPKPRGAPWFPPGTETNTKRCAHNREALFVVLRCPNIHPPCLCFSIAIYMQTELKQTTKDLKITNTFLVQYIIKSKTCGWISILPTSNRTQQVGPMGTIMKMSSGDPDSNLYRVISPCISSILRLDGNGGALQQGAPPTKCAIRSASHSHITVRNVKSQQKYCNVVKTGARWTTTWDTHNWQNTRNCTQYSLTWVFFTFWTWCILICLVCTVASFKLSCV